MPHAHRHRQAERLGHLLRSRVHCTATDRGCVVNAMYCTSAPTTSSPLVVLRGRGQLVSAPLPLRPLAQLLHQRGPARARRTSRRAFSGPCAHHPVSPKQINWYNFIRRDVCDSPATRSIPRQLLFITYGRAPRIITVTPATQATTATHNSSPISRRNAQWRSPRSSCG